MVMPKRVGTWWEADAGSHTEWTWEKRGEVSSRRRMSSVTGAGY